MDSETPLTATITALHCHCTARKDLLCNNSCGGLERAAGGDLGRAVSGDLCRAISGDLERGAGGDLGRAVSGDQVTSITPSEAMNCWATGH